jgi:hypothetical protein
MSAYETSQQLFEWCKVPPEELSNHPHSKVKFRILSQPLDVYRDIATTMIDEVKRNNEAN